MHIYSIEHICSGLKHKARTENFLSYSVDDIETEANDFVETFARENGLTAHTLSAFRWSFESGDHLLADGFIELKCTRDFMEHAGPCVFDTVSIAKVDKYKHSDKT
ncbi:MAG: hypothetical protein AAGB35_02825 [Pseudomonadota bacterium]